jgi:hypothetical protein
MSAAADLGPTVEVTLGAAADSYADSMYPKQAYGNRQVLYVGNSVDRAQNLTGPARIYIQFDISAVPKGALVNSAEILLYQMYAPASAQTYEVRIVRSPWKEFAMNWTTQPSSDAAAISSAVAPAAKDVWVSWNVTSAVQGWANGSTPDYGFMIRIQNEQKGASNEASGFYSREYPKEEVRPKLQILCASQPPLTYVFSARVNGLPSDLASVITADNRSTIRVSGGGVGYLLFGSGITHTLSADEYISASDSVRYHASVHSTTATTDGEFTIAYSPQYRVTVNSDPRGLIETESSKWYDAGARMTTLTAQEAFDEGLNRRNVFEGWYANDVKQAGNPIEYVVAAPANLTAQYVMMYNVTVSSPLGQVSGSGWHAAGSTVEVAVEPSYLPVEGPLGYLGFGASFDHWTGTVESTSSIVKVTVDGPVEEKAVWREDRSRLLAGVAVIIALLAVLAVLRRRSRHSGSRDSTGRPATKKKGKASFERPAIAKSSFHCE